MNQLCGNCGRRDGTHEMWCKENVPGSVTYADKPPTYDPLNTQVAGSHYKDLPIQPVEYIHANALGYFEGNVIKYISRWRKKNGIADLEKAKHYIDLLIQLEARHGGRG